MKNRIFYGSVIAAMAAVAPGLAFAQSVGYRASFPSVDQGQASASAHGPSYAQPYYTAAQPVCTGCMRQGSFPSVNEGQASASAHGPSYAAQPYYRAAQRVWTGAMRHGSFPSIDQGQASASAHGPS
jgi:hypothetical protein